MLREVDVVNRYLGVPYIHKGRSKEGMDCWGLVKAVYRDLGYALWDIEDYDKNWSKKGGNHFIDNYWREWEQVPIPHSFDVALFKTNGVANHAGVVLFGYNLLHSQARHGVVVSRILDMIEKFDFQGFYHLKARND